MKKFFAIFEVALLLVFTAGAATFNDYYSQGGTGPGDAGFAGSGIVHPVVGSVQSNTVWFVLPENPGQPRAESIWFKADLAASTLSFYDIISSTVTTGTGAAGTNVLLISVTNGIGSGDLLLLRNSASDCYTFIVNSNNSAATLVTYTSMTNGYAAGDKVYKLQQVASFTPLQMHSVTSQVIRPYADWIPFDRNGSPFQFTGRRGHPSVIALTYSNLAGLFVNGSFNGNPLR